MSCFVHLESKKGKNIQFSVTLRQRKEKLFTFLVAGTNEVLSDTNDS